MNVVSVPFRLRLAIFAIFLSLPLIAIEVAVAARAPWWGLPYRLMGYWALGFFLVCIPISSMLISRKQWAFPITVVLATFWILASTWQSIQIRYPPLGFFALFLIGLFLVYFFWIKSELEKSYIDPKIPWYQGFPKAIPGLKCQLEMGEKIVVAKVNRLDIEGAFVFTASQIDLFLKRKEVKLTFEFKDERIQCKGIPRIVYHERMAVGIQFSRIQGDLKKDLGDFIEILRGQGYV